MNKVDVKIMAVKTRRKMVLDMCKKMGLREEDTVIYDDRPSGGGPLYTCRKCWEAPIPEGVTHRIVLQDDLLMCNNFLGIMNRLVNAQPDFIFSLYCSRLKPEDADSRTPYLIIKGTNAWGQGMLMPVKHIKPMFEFADRELGKDFPYDDGIYIWYALAKKIPIATTIPSTIQHLCPVDSTLGYNDKRKVSKVWFGEDISQYNWDSRAFIFTKSMPNDVSLQQQKERLERLYSKPVYTIFRENEGNKFVED